MDNIKKHILHLPMLILTAVALVFLVLALFDLMIAGNNEIFSWSMVSILVLPLPLILAAIRVFIKMKNYSGSYKYGIRFWPAVMNAPKTAVLGIYGAVLLFICTLLISSISNSEDFALTGGLILFYYVPFVIFWSGYREVTENSSHNDSQLTK